VPSPPILDCQFARHDQGRGADSAEPLKTCHSATDSLFINPSIPLLPGQFARCHRAELRFECHLGMGWAATPRSRARGQLEKDKGTSRNGVLTTRSRPVSREGGGTTRTLPARRYRAGRTADVRRIMHKELSDSAPPWDDNAGRGFLTTRGQLPRARVGFHRDRGNGWERVAGPQVHAKRTN
jgi:hypothetical protein